MTYTLDTNILIGLAQRYPRVMPRGNRKAGDRRLVKMSPDAVDDAWYPDLPPVEENEDTFLISATTWYTVRYALDKYQRLTDWAVIQRCNDETGSRRVAVYDACHGKGVHVHIYDRSEKEIDEHPLHRRVRSYGDLEDGLDYATERVVKDYEQNERRSARGN